MIKVEKAISIERERTITKGKTPKKQKQKQQQQQTKKQTKKQNQNITKQNKKPVGIEPLH